MSGDGATIERHLGLNDAAPSDTLDERDGAGAAAAVGEPTITIHPHGELTTYFGRATKVVVPITPGETIGALVERLAVPADEIWLYALNGETAKPGAALGADDSLELFSPVAGG